MKNLQKNIIARFKQFIPIKHFMTYVVKKDRSFVNSPLTIREPSHRRLSFQSLDLWFCALVFQQVCLFVYVFSN